MDKMNRRDFLGLGAAGAGFLATTALGMTPATASAKAIEYGPAVSLPDAQIPALTGDVLQHVEKLPIRKDVDVLVAGGGVAGVAAALAAKRAGKDVLLLEKTTLLGGLATIGLINYFEPLCNGRGKQVIFGMCEEFLRLSMKVGFNTLPKEWENGEPKEPTNKRYTNRYSPQIFALQLTDLLHREGVQLLFDCIASTPVMEGGHCKGV
ncbi:MAG: FAD-dependent oxidoreductase, partial [Victivallales bacterium]|nr:FAD-dependent oxidoreductase [Victivallales bacterium]